MFLQLGEEYKKTLLKMDADTQRVRRIEEENKMLAHQLEERKQNELKLIQEQEALRAETLEKQRESETLTNNLQSLEQQKAELQAKLQQDMQFVFLFHITFIHELSKKP